MVAVSETRARGSAGRSPERAATSSLIAAVGHRFWRDRSAGPVWLDRWAGLSWPDGVALEDFSFGALAMTQQLEASSYGRLLLVTAESRERPPGSLYLARHRPAPASPEHVQACIAEAGSGVIAIDLLLVVAGHFGALPEDTWVLEIEPADTGWGDGLSVAVEARYDEALALMRAFAENRGWPPEGRA